MPDVGEIQYIRDLIPTILYLQRIRFLMEQTMKLMDDRIGKPNGIGIQVVVQAEAVCLDNPPNR